jgi:hypothetical protein
MFLPLRAAQALSAASKGEVGRGMGSNGKWHRIYENDYLVTAQK